MLSALSYSEEMQCGEEDRTGRLTSGPAQATLEQWLASHGTRTGDITHWAAVANATGCPVWQARIPSPMDRWVLPAPGGPRKTTLSLAVTRSRVPRCAIVSRLRERWWSKSNSSNDLRAGNPTDADTPGRGWWPQVVGRLADAQWVNSTTQYLGPCRGRRDDELLFVCVDPAKTATRPV